MEKVDASRLMELLFQKLGKMDHKRVASLLGITESSLSKFLKGQCKRQSTSDRYLSGFAALLGMSLVELKKRITSYSSVLAFEEDEDRHAIAGAFEALKSMEAGEVQVPVVDMIWDGIYGVVRDMSTPSLEMMEWLAMELQPLTSTPKLCGSRRIDFLFKNLLSDKMREVWKYILQRKSKGRERVMKLSQSIVNWPISPVAGHQISKKLTAKYI